MGPVTLRLRDLAGAVVLLAFGAAFLLLSTDLKMGTPQRMGPGFLPLVLSVLLCLLGTALLLKALISTTAPDVARRESTETAEWPTALRGLACIIGGGASFVILLPPFGLLPAVFASTAILSQSRAGLKIVHTLLLSASVTAGAWFAFIQLLGMTIVPFRWQI